MNEYKEFLKHLGINPMLMVADMRSRLPASEKPVSVKENKEKYKEILRLKCMLENEIEIFLYEDRDFCDSCFPIVCREVFNKANNRMTVKEVKEKISRLLTECRK